MKPSSASVVSEIQTPPEISERRKTLSRKRSEPVIQLMDELREESEKEEEPPKKSSRVKTPRRSAGEESGFSDYNPFQSGSEAAAERERRRRKVRSESSRRIIS